MIGKATAEVQAGGERRKTVREKLRESLTDFIKLIDDLVQAIQKKTKRKVLVVIDTLDHVDHRPVRDIFTNHWASLSRPSVSLLIVLPLPMLHEKQFMAAADRAWSLLPNIKVYSGPESSNLDTGGFEFFKQVIGHLASLSLFDEDSLEDLFRLSGGMIRDMIGFAGDACTFATLDDPAGKVQRRHVERVLNGQKASFRRILTTADYQVLEQVRQSPFPKGTEALGPLLDLKAVIFYPNGEGWYGLNPAVAAILDAPPR